MTNVVSFAPTPALALTREAQADYLQNIADSLRAGEFEIDRCVVVFALKSGGVACDIFGGPSNVMEAVGLLTIGQYELMRNPGGE